jgi:type I restriction enzyme S subunit
MEPGKGKYINLITYQLMHNWSVRYLIESRFSYNNKYELIPIRTFLTKSRERIRIQDGKAYKRVTIKTNNGGVVQRDIEYGEKIGTKQQYEIKAGQFLMSKIDARNGAFGLVPENLEGAIVTNDFPVFDIDSSIINPEFLVLITSTREFIKFAQSCSSGTTNRQRIDIEMFLNVKIPVPPLPEQNRIVEAYNEKINQAEEFERKTKELEIGIEVYLLNCLGLEKIEIKQFRKGKINLFPFSKSIYRWDIHKDLSSSISSLENANYPIRTLFEVFNFENRSWNNKEFQEEFFNYVELGAIDPLLGITRSKKLEVKRAPSRATQLIRKGDLILGTTRPYLKRFAIVSEQFDKSIASSGFQVISTSEHYNLDFLLEYLKSDYGVKQFELYMTGALYPAITNRDLKKIQIPIPPISVQNEIVETIKTTKKEIKKLKVEINELKAKAIKDFENEIFKT